METSDDHQVVSTSCSNSNSLGIVYVEASVEDSEEPYKKRRRTSSPIRNVFVESPQKSIELNPETTKNIIVLSDEKINAAATLSLSVNQNATMDSTVTTLNNFHKECESVVHISDHLTTDDLHNVLTVLLSTASSINSILSERKCS
eukprot:NODE_5898_length_952_cov_42.691194_g5313_i0.p1 GENE.NODE_5898_length_952_cov_42.691194_g5313_i0~~NODE_5898_length_952_cov_42.691194_g5313_i0.p1  ORF type:complete len:146 (+),score=24.94 NODE_5898_length_952_cov_42.691194_g5313_i0:316-753(+)